MFDARFQKTGYGKEGLACLCYVSEQFVLTWALGGFLRVSDDPTAADSSIPLIQHSQV